MSSAETPRVAIESNVIALMAVVLGLVLGALAFELAGSAAASFDASDAGLGKNTISWSSEIDGLPVSARGDRPETVVRLVETMRTLRDRGRPIVLWLGASQLHAVNHAKPGDELASYFATRAARERGSDLAYVQLSSPNANLHDLLAMYRRIRQEGIRPDWLTIALVYDDLREDGIQAAITDQLEPIETAEAAAFGAAWKEIEVRRVSHTEEEEVAPIERTVLGGTPQQRLEDAIVSGLETRWTAFASRGDLNSWLRFEAVRRATSLTVGMTGRRKLLIPDALRLWNMRALDSFVRLSESDGFELFVYKQPHRDDQKVFQHDRLAYDTFFAQLESAARKRGFHYADLETIVPGRYWGLTNGDMPDCFHFTVDGHMRLGAAVDAGLAGWTD